MKDNGVQTFAPVRKTATPPLAPAPASADRSPKDGEGHTVTVRRMRIAMGTFIALQATSVTSAEAEAAVEAAFAAIVEVECRMHPQSPGSDLARINNSPLLTAVAIHPSTSYLLNLARLLNALTRGVFDPCLPTRAGRLVDIEAVDDRVVCRAPVAVDFGGFAKGYAVDCAIDVLLDRGCAAGLVNAGGDLRVFGATEPIFLRGSTATTGQLTEVMLADAALAVSDANSPDRPAEHQGYYVRDGLATNGVVADYAAVVAKQAVIADALAKCVLLCPAETAAGVLRAFDATRLLNQ